MSSFAVKNNAILPMGYDFSTLYGFPNPVWELYSQNNIENFRLFTYEYTSNSIVPCSYPQNIIINILLPIVYGVLIFVCNKNKSKALNFIQGCCLYSSFLFIIVMFVNIFAPWKWQIYRLSYLLLISLGVIIGILLLTKYILFSIERLKIKT